MKYEINCDTNFETLRKRCAKCIFAYVDCLSFPCKSCRDNNNNTTDTGFKTGTRIEQWYIKNSEI